MTIHAPSKARRTRCNLTLILAFGGGLFLSGCAGENLFSVTAGVSELGPQVLITAPGEGFTISVGDSILVLADVTAAEGAVTAEYSGDYTSGEAAYTAQTASLGGVTFVRLTKYLRAVDAQVAGAVYIVVEVTDQSGGVGKDSVKVTIN